MSDDRAYWRIVPKTGGGPDVYRRRFATRVVAEQLLDVLQRPGYEVAEYAPNGKRCVRTTADGTAIE